MLSKGKGRQKALQILKEKWGYEDFRPVQGDIILSVLSGRHTVGLLPTGGGKSICYQLPALCSEGLTLVVSPLIALMEDQVYALKKIGIKAEALHSGKSYKDLDRILDNCIYGNIKMLYVSPERLENELFLSRLEKMNVNCLAIDEAHCISQWGHDFRPAYLKIGQLRQHWRDIPVLALTATATANVLKEIVQHLDIPDAQVFRKSFVRENIHIDIIKSEKGIANVKALCQKLSGKIIIYVRSRRLVKMISNTLAADGHAASFYHAGLDYKQKEKIQTSFQDGRTRIVVATNAFGMGIDVDNVRCVVHYGLPGSVEEYYQEIGRAGRDGKPSKAVMLYHDGDLKRSRENFAVDFAPLEAIQGTYKAICVHYNIGVGEGMSRSFAFKLDNIAKKLNTLPKVLNGHIKALKLLGLLELSDEFREKHLVQILVSPREYRTHLDDPKTGRLMEQLIRENPGVFDEWMALDLNRLALTLNSSSELIEEQLRTCSQKGLITYFTQQVGPRVVFLESRVSGRDFPALGPKFKHLRDLAEKRFQGVEELVNCSICRSRFILAYFDESNKTDCMNCDNCLRVERIPSNEQLRQMDQTQLTDVIAEAVRNNRENLLDRLQSLEDEGLISLPEDVFK